MQRSSTLAIGAGIMLLKSYNLGGRQPVVFAVLAAMLALALLYLPILTFIADFRYGSIQTILDNKETKVVDTMTLTTQSMPDYLEAVEIAKTVSSIEPSRAKYHYSLGAFYLKLGRWAQDIESYGLPLPKGALPSKDAYELAKVEFERAIELEPLDPYNHFDFGVLLDLMKAAPELSEKEYERAAQGYQVNAPLRYAIMQQYFRTGRAGHALEYARKLAAVDDTYLLSDKYDKKEIIELRPRHYMTKVSKSYLFKALEMAWRVTKDAQVVKGIAPDNEEARAVMEYFFDLNNIDK